MKKMSFTLLKPGGWIPLIGKTAFLVLLALCFSGLQSLSAQTATDHVVHPQDIDDDGQQDTTGVYKIEACADANVLYTDDNTGDGELYYDNHAADFTGFVPFSRDTLEICPQDQWHAVTVTFTEFDIAFGDFLQVWDGDTAALNAGTALHLGGVAGTGVSNAFGGWVSANCDPGINPSGCLTFIFYRNGDNRKGTGWEAWVTCADRGIEVKANIPSYKIACDDADGLADVEIPAPDLSADCGAIDPGMTLIVHNQNGDVCFEADYAAASVIPDPVAIGAFGAGLYTAEWYITVDPKKTSKKQPFSISLPALVCNDDVNIPLGSACALEIAPDDVLENPCEAPFFTYNVTVKFGSGKKTIITGSGSGSVSDWPEITKELIEEAGLDVCGGTAEVTIERVYTPDAIAAPDCDNGPTSEFCKTTVTFADQSAPFVSLSLAADTLIACDTTGLYELLGPTVLDNCDDEATFDFSVTMAESAPCFGGNDTTEAYITYSATDACGNTSPSRVDTVVILRPKDFAVPPSAELECDGSDDDKDLGIPGVEIGYVENGDTTITDTIELSTEEYICGYILNKVVQPIPETDCGKKEYITWYALDWCDPATGPVAIGSQFIEYTDTKAPTFIDTVEAGVAFPLEIELDHFDCTYDITKLAGPRATDNCSVPQVRLAGIYRIEDGEKWEIDYTDLECDSFCLRWVAEDACHEQTEYDEVDQVVVIKDVTKPSAICTDQLNVSLPNDWGARVYVDDIDAGSYDACGIATREIRIKHKYDDPEEGWNDYVDIGCEYVHDGLQIEMRVTDNKGNANVCWLDVLVEDKLAPICDDLEDVTINCDAGHVNLLGASTDADEDGEMEDDEWVDMTADQAEYYNDLFGLPYCEDNLKGAECGALGYEQQYQLIIWPCGEIKAKRRYRAIDWNGEGNKSNWAEQKIDIVYVPNWKVTFPADVEGTCGDELDGGDIEIVNGFCDLVGYEVKEKRFEVPGDACYKIERTYHVINWCKYEAGQDPLELDRVEGNHGKAVGLMIDSDSLPDVGYFTYVQILKIHDDEAPVVTIHEPDACINGVDFDALPYGEEDQTPGAEPFECDELKTWTASATDCSTILNWTGYLYADGELVRQTTTNEISMIVQKGVKYEVEFWASDGCGNSGGDRTDELSFWDCKKPTPYVLNGVAVELGQTGSVSVWATDLDQNSFDNCTDQSYLDLRIWHQSLGDAPTDLDGVKGLPKVVDFGCTYLGTQVVNIYVIDEEDNWDFASTYVLVQDNMNVCTTDAEDNMVAGFIVNPVGENVQSVNVAINDGTQHAMTTAENGHFQFMLPKGGDYTVTPAKDINPLNGVSTFDLVLISKHILGITAFDTPYKYIAADVNKSGSITAFDMVQLRQLILNITSEFPNNDSWRFVDAAYVFSTENPAAENFNESISINNLSANMESVNFVAVKVGDVNGNALANSLVGAEVRNTNGTMNLNVADRFVEAGQTVNVEFTAADLATIEGYQFTMNFAGLEMTELVEGVAKAANFNTAMAQRGVITTSWNGEANADEVLFGLTFKATTTGLLSDLISVNSDFTRAEAYNTAGDLLNVNINFAAAEVATTFDLKQNTPNPFNEETVIGFNLPEAGTATLKVMDVQGKVLKAITAEYAKGYNQVTVNAKELSATGVLYYQLESADKVATKKMIIIE